MKKLFIGMCLLAALSGINTFAADTKDKAAAKPTLPVVEIKTTMGNMQIELYPEKAPVTVKNFLNYVAKKRLQQNNFSPGNQRLHDSGRRF